MYQSPSSKLMSLDDDLGGAEFRPKMYWSIYWRSILVFFISSLFDIPLLLFIDFNSDYYVKSLPAISFGLVGLGLLVANLIFSRGLTYIFWGKKLSISHDFWRMYGLFYSSGYLIFALIHYAIAQFDSGYYWAVSKFVGPAILLLVYPVLCCFLTSKLTKRT